VEHGGDADSCARKILLAGGQAIGLRQWRLRLDTKKAADCSASFLHVTFLLSFVSSGRRRCRRSRRERGSRYRHALHSRRTATQWGTNQIRYRRNLYRPGLFAHCPIMDTRQLVNTMKKILLATVAILAFTAPSFAAETGKTVGQAQPSSASSFYLTQDAATMKCQVVNAQPAAGGNQKVIGAAHPTQASAETALAADKNCK
jgi:hypothetical protein